MYSLEEIFNQALEDHHSRTITKPLGMSVLNYGAKIQKFPSKTEILRYNIFDDPANYNLIDTSIYKNSERTYQHRLHCFIFLY